MSHCITQMYSMFIKHNILYSCVLETIYSSYCTLGSAVRGNKAREGRWSRGPIHYEAKPSAVLRLETTAFECFIPQAQHVQSVL